MAKTVTTIQGDTWDIIAKRVYGKENLMHILINANIQHRKIALFPAGIVLNIPEIDIDAIEYDDTLPVWKRQGGAQ